MMTTETKATPPRISEFMDCQLSDWYRHESRRAKAAYLCLDEETRNALEIEGELWQKKLKAGVSFIIGGGFSIKALYPMTKACMGEAMTGLAECYKGQFFEEHGAFLLFGAAFIVAGAMQGYPDKQRKAAVAAGRAELNAKMDVLKKDNWNLDEVFSFVADRGRGPESKEELAQWKSYEVKLEKLRQARDQAVPSLV